MSLFKNLFRAERTAGRIPKPPGQITLSGTKRDYYGSASLYPEVNTEAIPDATAELEMFLIGAMERFREKVGVYPTITCNSETIQFPQDLSTLERTYIEINLDDTNSKA